MNSEHSLAIPDPTRDNDGVTPADSTGIAGSGGLDVVQTAADVEAAELIASVVGLMTATQLAAAAEAEQLATLQAVADSESWAVLPEPTGMARSASPLSV